jgi:hypothetical protein
MVKDEFEKGDSVIIESLYHTDAAFGVNEDMRMLAAGPPVRIGSVDMARRRVRILGWNFHPHDLSLAKKLTKKEKEKLDKICALEKEYPKRIPKYIETSRKLMTKGCGYHDNNFVVYSTKKVEDAADMTWEKANRMGSRTLLIGQGRSCFGSIPEYIEYYVDDFSIVPDRVLYYANFKNSVIPKSLHMTEAQIKKWVILCKRNHFMPSYVSGTRFAETREMVLHMDKHDIDHLFFYLVNARYCDEQPFIPLLTMFYMDEADLDFNIAYVLAHYMVPHFDEEHAGLPFDNDCSNRVKERIRVVHDEDWGEYSMKNIYNPPAPRFIISWALRLYRFVRYINTVPKKEIKDGQFWALHSSIMITVKARCVPLSINNKSFRLIKTINLEALNKKVEEIL